MADFDIEFDFSATEDEIANEAINPDVQKEIEESGTITGSFDVIDGKVITVEKPVQKVTNIYDHPVVKELMAQVTSLNDKISDFERALPVFNEQAHKLDVQRDDLLHEYKKRLNELDQQRVVISNRKNEIESSIRLIREQQEQLRKGIDATVEEIKAEQRINELQKKWEAVLGSAAWKNAIFEYQMIGARFMASQLKCLNADQMGLGKTLQTLAAINLTDQDFPETGPDRAVLWITKKALMHTTAREIQRWLPGRKFVIADSGSRDAKEFIAELAFKDGAICIISYDSLNIRETKNQRAGYSKLLDYGWKRVVTDEAHRYKNEGTHFFKNVKRAANTAEQFIALTGTPIQNRPEDFWAILNMIMPERFPKKYNFINEYCYQIGFRNEVAQFRSGQYDRLINNVKDNVIRRRKDEVELELPDILQDDRYVEMAAAQRALYDQMRDKFAIWLDNQQEEYIAANNVLAHFTRLMQIALYPKGIKVTRADGTEKIVDLDESVKLDEAMDLITELLENDERVVVFSVFNPVLKEMQRRINALGSINGKPARCEVITDSPAAHVVDAAIERYNTGETMVLASNVRGGLAEGQNLQMGSHVIFLGQWWNPGVNNQARERMHRIGQKKNVEVHIIHAVDSIDAYIQQKLDAKVDMFTQVFERKELRKALDAGLI